MGFWDGFVGGYIASKALSPDTAPPAVQPSDTVLYWHRDRGWIEAVVTEVQRDRVQVCYSFKGKTKFEWTSPKNIRASET